VRVNLKTLIRMRLAREALVRAGYLVSLGSAASILLPGKNGTPEIGAALVLALAGAAGVLWLIDAVVMAKADRRIASRHAGREST